MSTELKKYFELKRPVIESLLERHLDNESSIPENIHKAMRYSVLNGGKRLRPILVMLGNLITNGKEPDSYPASVAVELVHCYSLVHDDLPSLDNDDYRRGKLTCHKQFSESLAILTGDALLTKSFEILTDIKDENILKNILIEFTNAIGSKGMIGGQVVDLESEAKVLKDAEKTLKYIHKNKTGKLIESSLIIGAMSASADKETITALRNYGKDLGLVFQITDDILDIVGDKKKLGKKGSDIDNKKLTYPSIYGLDKSYELAEKTTQNGHSALDIIKNKNKFYLHDLLDYILKRTY